MKRHPTYGNLVAKKKKKKLRVTLRKNIGKRARQGNITRSALDDVHGDRLWTSERVSGKGELTRRRTIVAVEGEQGRPILRDVDESKCVSGRVISAVGLNSLVQNSQGRLFDCTVRRVVRSLARDARNIVVTGDSVLFQPLDNDAGVIEWIEPRRATLSRGSRNKEHILVANVDQVLIVASADEPPLKPSLIDRFLVSAEKGGVRGVICINKIDLVDPVALVPLTGLYAQLGYDVVAASALTGRGIARLRNLLKDRATVLAGQSGVGKSTLINAIEPDLKLKTGEINRWTGKGKHTTRIARLLPLECGGWVVDTPGVRQFKLWDVLPEELEGFFVEFRPFVTRCKFPDCSHTHEESCGVKQAVENGLISPARYESYLTILGDDPADARSKD